MGRIIEGPHPDDPFLMPPAETLDRLGELLLTRLAGADRTRAGFIASRNTVLQRQILDSYGVGLTRGARLADRGQTLSGVVDEQKARQLLGAAYDRLSAGERMRLEDLPALVSEALKTARESALTGLEARGTFDRFMTSLAQTHLQRIARTESVFAATAGSRDQLRQYGVERVRWIIGPEACPLCQEYQGQEIPIDDVENQPPIHPNCACDVEPVLP